MLLNTIFVCEYNKYHLVQENLVNKLISKVFKKEDFSVLLNPILVKKKLSIL